MCGWFSRGFWVESGMWFCKSWARIGGNAGDPGNAAAQLTNQPTNQPVSEPGSSPEPGLVKKKESSVRLVLPKGALNLPSTTKPALIRNPLSARGRPNKRLTAFRLELRMLMKPCTQAILRPNKRIPKSTEAESMQTLLSHERCSSKLGESLKVQARAKRASTASFGLPL